MTKLVYSVSTAATPQRTIKSESGSHHLSQTMFVTEDRKCSIKMVVVSKVNFSYGTNEML